MPDNTIHEFDTDMTVTIKIDESGHSWHLAAGVTIDAVGYGIDELALFTGNDIDVDGFIASDIGVRSYGAGSAINIGVSGAVFGLEKALQLGGDDQFLFNSGAIISKTMGIFANEGNNRVIENSGVISAKHGLVGTGNNLTFDNFAGAAIFASLNAISLDTPNDYSWTVNNEGNIKGGAFSVHLKSTGNNVLTNTGVLDGDVLFGSGDDVFDTSHGLLKGLAFMGAGNDIVKAVQAEIDGIFYLGDGNDEIDLRGATGDVNAYGNAGDDLYFVSSKSHLLNEGLNEGIDTVKSTASYTLADNFENLTLIGKAKRNAIGNELDNVLTGNNGKNTIKGMAGDDTIAGGKGADKLIGGSGADVFIFANKGGHDKIMDFKPGSDSIDLSHLTAITSFSDLKQHHMSAAHGDVIITAGKDQLILDGVKIGDLHKGDFDF